MNRVGRRFELRLDERLWAKVREEARERGIAMAEVIRESLEARYQVTTEQKREAARELCRIGASVDDWERMEDEIGGEHNH